MYLSILREIQINRCTGLDRIFHNIFREQNPIFENKILSYFHRRMMLQYFRYRTDLNSDLRLLIFIFFCLRVVQHVAQTIINAFQMWKSEQDKNVSRVFHFRVEVTPSR